MRAGVGRKDVTARYSFTPSTPSEATDLSTLPSKTSVSNIVSISSILSWTYISQKFKQEIKMII